MPGPTWNEDDPADADLIRTSTDLMIRAMVTDAPARVPASVDLVQGWHTRLYAGCALPSAQYVGAFRGDPSRPDLVQYEVGVGPLQPDGLPAKVGVWSQDVADQVDAFVAALNGVLVVFDRILPVGSRPHTVEELDAVVSLIAQVHGDWVRVHPFANGNGRTARAWAAWLALRYGLPVFVQVKPRPDDVAYARAARESMGRPPAFVGNHEPARAVFAHLLALALLT